MKFINSFSIIEKIEDKKKKLVSFQDITIEGFPTF